MPNYRAKVKLLVGHESRVIEEGGDFFTIFPKVKVDGKLVDMKLGSNLELIGYTDAEAAEIAAAAKDAPVDPVDPPQDPEADPAKDAPVSRVKK